MRVADSGVVVAAFASWHEAHRAARQELLARPRVVAHAMLETFSVLTRLPHPHRAPAALVAEFLGSAFHEEPLSLSANEVRELVVGVLPRRGIEGGAAYDALIAETTRRAGGRLVSLDRRALATYERIGCDAELLI